MSGNKLSRSAKNLVLSAVAFFEAEKKLNGPVIPFENAQHRLCAALGISPGTVTSILKEAKSGPVISPKRKFNRAKPVRDIDEFHQSAIRRTVYNLYKEKKHITIHSLLAVLEQKDLFHGSPSSLFRVLHDLQFKWKIENNRRFLVERRDIVEARFRFLKLYIRNKKNPNPLPVVFMDETWIFQKGSPVRTWQDNSKESVRKPAGDGGRRYIVVHAGCEKGFIPAAKLIFASKQNTGDYHGDMDANNYIKWLQNQLLPSLEEPSLIIIDNAPYHSTLLERVPNTSWRKQELRDWLTSKKINFADTDFKQDLLSLVNINKPQKIYQVDNIIHEAGHSVLRLPPYHCHFNPIELIWGIAKPYYNRHISEMKNGSDSEVKRVWQQAIDHITEEMWCNAIKHTDGIIQQAWDEEVQFDSEDVQPLIINTEDTDSSDED